MSEVISIAHLHKDFKTIEEWKEFAEKQLLTINFLQSANDQLKENVSQLEKIVSQSVPIIGDQRVDKIIVSPERALVEDQILMIQQRAYMKELTLEDVKKLDILLKHQKILKDSENVLDGKSKKIAASNEELLKIVQNDNN